MGLDFISSRHKESRVRVQTRARRMVQAVKRNLERFPADFMFQLIREEHANLKSHFVISSWGGVRSAPYAFTEQGVAMLSSVLRSPRAVQVNIAIMRAFVKLRELLASHRNLARRLNEVESKYDAHFKVVFDAIRKLMTPPEKHRGRIGFTPPTSRPVENLSRGRPPKFAANHTKQSENKFSKIGI
jgi:hypothetical protein